jgi:hypothetical protein
VLLLSFVSTFRKATIIWVRTLCCEKSTLLVYPRFLSGCNGFIKKWLRLTLIIVNINVDLSHHLLPSYALQKQFWKGRIAPHFPVCRFVGWFCRYSLGFIARPINRMLPERLSRIKNKNGWSARKTGISSGLIAVTPTTAVAWLSRHAGIHAIFNY